MLRDQFRISPPSSASDFKAAGKLAGCSEAMARRAWSRGFVGIEAIEIELARERAQQTQLAEVLKNENLVREAKVLAKHLAKAMRDLSAHHSRLVGSVLADDKEIDADTALKRLHRIAKMNRDLSAVMTNAVQLDRLINNEATEIVEVDHVVIDLDEAQEEVERLERAVRRERAQRQGQLTDGNSDGDGDIN